MYIYVIDFSVIVVGLFGVCLLILMFYCVLIIYVIVVWWLWYCLIVFIVFSECDDNEVLGGKRCGI